VARQTITPLDLEQTYGVTGGHILHGEPGARPALHDAPLLGWAQYRTPIRGLYL
jgi:phytoene dehydrogenase-like protein